MSDLDKVLSFIDRHGTHAIRVIDPEYEPGAVICDECPVDDRVVLSDSHEYDVAAMSVHQAFCEPNDEKVSTWDYEMAAALTRRGLVIANAVKCRYEGCPLPDDVEWHNRAVGMAFVESRFNHGLTA